jgi:hypothetical protein
MFWIEVKLLNYAHQELEPVGLKSRIFITASSQQPADKQMSQFV